MSKKPGAAERPRLSYSGTFSPERQFGATARSTGCRDARPYRPQAAGRRGCVGAPTRQVMVRRSRTWAVETSALWIGAQHTKYDPRDVVEDGDAGQQIHPSRHVRVMQATY